MRVRDVMTQSPRTLLPQDTVQDAMLLMADLDVRHVPIVSDGVLVGVISDRDLRAYARATLEESEGASERASERRRVRLGDVMSSDVLSIAEEEELDEAITLFLEQKVGAIPVVDPEGNLTGIVSTVDVLRVAQGRL